MSPVTLTFQEEIAVIAMRHGNSNGMDATLVAGIRDAFAQAHRLNSVKAVVLTSALPRFFSPGLDLFALYPLEREAMRAFFRSFTECCLEMFQFPKPLVCAVNGHAVAGGMILTLPADYRVMADGKNWIGLNELKIGVPIPYGIVQMLKHAMPPRTVRQILCFGKNHSPAEALQWELVDEVVAPEKLQNRAMECARELVAKSEEAFRHTKRYLRAETAQSMAQHDPAEVETFLDGWFSQETRARMKTLMDGLKNK